MMFILWIVTIFSATAQNTTDIPLTRDIDTSTDTSSASPTQDEEKSVEPEPTPAPRPIPVPGIQQPADDQDKDDTPTRRPSPQQPVDKVPLVPRPSQGTDPTQTVPNSSTPNEDGDDVVLIDNPEFFDDNGNEVVPDKSGGASTIGIIVALSCTVLAIVLVGGTLLFFYIKKVIAKGKNREGPILPIAHTPKPVHHPPPTTHLLQPTPVITIVEVPSPKKSGYSPANPRTTSPGIPSYASSHAGRSYAGDRSHAGVPFKSGTQVRQRPLAGTARASMPGIGVGQPTRSRASNPGARAPLSSSSFSAPTLSTDSPSSTPPSAPKRKTRSLKPLPNEAFFQAYARTQFKSSDSIHHPTRRY